MNRYKDIIHLPHHTSPTRPRMSMSDRAAQFSPFAALTGYDALVRETARYTDSPVELDADHIAVLNRRLQLRHTRLQQSAVTLTYFEPDTQKTGGTYRTVTGPITRICPQTGCITLEDGTQIPFDRITEIESDILDCAELPPD